MDATRLENVIHRIKGERKGNDQETRDLKRVIYNIKHAYMKDLEDSYLTFIPKFLNKLDKGLPIPVLSICGRGTQEIRYTSYLGYMLDPARSHGLKESFLKIVFDEIAKLNDLQEEWYSQCKVETELWLGNYIENDRTINCYCDIGIIGEDFVILLEQKILSSESNHEHTDLGQLTRYSHCLENNTEFNQKKIMKVYLTPSGELSGTTSDWIPFSHTQLIEKGIELFRHRSLSPVARENLKRFLLDLAIGPYQITEDRINEMRDIGKEINENFVYNKVIRFSQLVKENRLVINVIMEGDFDE